MPLGVELQGIEPPKGGAITAQPCVDEFLLRTAQDIDGNFWCAQLAEEVGEGMQDNGRDFQLCGQLDDLRTGAPSHYVRGALITPLDASENDQRLVHSGDGIIVLFVDLRAPLGGDRAAETVHVQDQKAHTQTLCPHPSLTALSPPTRGKRCVLISSFSVAVSTLRIVWGGGDLGRYLFLDLERKPDVQCGPLLA